MSVSKALCASGLILIALLCGCGTPGAPQPPSLNLATPVTDLRAERSGNEVRLTWTPPRETTDGATFRHHGPTKICRAMNVPHTDHCDEVASLPPAPRNAKTATASDSLPSQSGSADDYATYSVQVENDRGRSAGLSNQVQVPAAPISTVNDPITARVAADAVIVSAPITTNGIGVPQSLQFRRREANAPQEITVASAPLEIDSVGQVKPIELRDETFAWEKTYTYRVVLTATAKLPNGPVSFEGSSSQPVSVIAHDIFPPAVPTGVQAVYSGSFAGQQASLDLTWNPDTDRDLVGYFVFRRRGDEPVSAARKLNQQPIIAPAYRDADIQPGNTYFYSVSAIDQRGNESARSEEASESVPK
jgi:hypothetical protein